MAGGSEPRERPNKDLVLLQGQWEATAGLLVVVLVWFSVPGRNTEMCIFDRQLWLQAREWTVGDRRGSRKLLRRLILAQVVGTGLVTLEMLRSIQSPATSRRVRFAWVVLCPFRNICSSVNPQYL